MSSYVTSINFRTEADVLETVFSVLRKYQHEDYYAYEREEIGRSSITDVMREFVSEGTKAGYKIFGLVGFNFAAKIRGQHFTPGSWPLIALLVPRIEITLHQQSITIRGDDEEEVKALHHSIRHGINNCDFTSSQNVYPIDTDVNKETYITGVGKALDDISVGRYTKIIPSRALDINHKIDMQATLLAGRQSNNPARSFSISHAGYQATGFSPELVMSAKNGKIVTEPLAGTRSAKGTREHVERLRNELLSDPKEIVEHIISVKEAIQELQQVCSSDTVKVDDLMSIRERGSVQHLGSSVSGILSSEKDMWDAFNVLFPSITASGIPKNAAIDGIQRLEERPRELYSGAILLIENSDSLEAALVLRTVFQDESRGWIQAGAGVISQSNPQRELIETREKLASIAPFIVLDARNGK
ncbi:hypothetical protein N7468_002873 [Penicillium chermesinum]|uniref:Chorismate-utilising enzyme C-terminal domain-containing protein n=1 Tax=Penicillium chermesinum TaxID=63820 RepID=A0A9W9PJG4_9EURO|nr:uncharacterized protein N7468_002873 [Penicillium chermesinum]KAJ5247890.1 hypothetical protein N7468_002873 [Penicillium chermesinum]